MSSCATIVVLFSHMYMYVDHSSFMHCSSCAFLYFYGLSTCIKIFQRLPFSNTLYMFWSFVNLWKSVFPILYMYMYFFFKDHNLKVTQLLDIHHQWTFDQLLWWYYLDKIWLLAWYIETLVGKFGFWILCSLEKSPLLATLHVVTAEKDEPYIFFWSGVRVGLCWIYVQINPLIIQKFSFQAAEQNAY